MTKQSLGGALAVNTFPMLQAMLSKSYRFIAIDVETANSDASSICQIGMACVEEGGVEEVVTLLIDPQCEFSEMDIQIHGIRPEHVSGQPLFEDFLDAIGDFLERHMLVQHSSFDGRAIRCATEACGRVPRPLKWHDSVMVARRAWPEFKGNGGHGLGHLKTALGLDFRHHDAGEDARAAAEVILRAELLMGISFAEILSRPTGSAVKSAIMRAGCADGPLSGKVAVFTGALSMTRSEAAEAAARVGITTTQSVSKKVHLLVVGDQDLSVMAAGQNKSSKHRKAEKLIAEGHDLQIIGETEFLNLVARS